MRDRYYQKILAGLDGLDHPNAFEECVCDLLRDAYPSLVWIRGGADAGMDGAIADTEGEAYPLIVTTAKDVARNLRKNLGSYTHSGKERRMAVLATSRRLTPPKVEDLKAIARKEYGFTLDVHDQYNLAARLVHNSRWARDLLGVTGEPPALSAVPRTRRPLEDIELIGRDADLWWLRETEGPRLVVGQPGSGKTALLLQLVREGKALFLASDDEARIAEAYRDSKPALILVDDAHVDLEKLTRLRQIRADIGAEFEIVASTWPGAEDDVTLALGEIGSGNIRHLELLTRAEIVQVLRGIGVSEPDDHPYMSLLVDQSANKPGLAVTLGSLWLRGEGHDLLTGKALQRSLIPALKLVLENDPTQLLACFALGGESGMTMEAVGEFLGEGIGEIHRRASLASQGGVLSVQRDGLSVQPEPLRSVLLAEVFFTPPALPYRPLVDRAPNRAGAVETLAIAALREVDIPRDELRALVLEAGSRQAWQAFAQMGEAEGQWVLEHFPVGIATVTPYLLRSAPRATIQRLLQEAESAEGPLHSHPDHPLRLLQDWVTIADSRHDPEQFREIVRRRQMLVGGAREYLHRRGNRTVGLRACFLALGSSLFYAGRVATGGLSIGENLLPISAVPQILELWTEVHKELGEFTPESWSQLQETLQGWVWPNVLGRESTGDEVSRYREVARRIVSDLVDHAQDHPGLAFVLKSWADLTNLSIVLHKDDGPDLSNLSIVLHKDGGFAVLFPLMDHLTPENWEEESEKQRLAATLLATSWAARPPQEVVRHLTRFAAEARIFGHRESEATSGFFQGLARQVDAPEKWLSAFLEARLPAQWMSPVLERAVKERRHGWEQTLKRCFESDAYSWLAGDIAIRADGISQELIDSALTRLPYHSVETACARKQVPLETLQYLLTQGREEVAVAAAVGEWLSDPRGEVRPQILDQWRLAVLRLGSTDCVERLWRGQSFWLKEILGSDPDLAAAWLESRLEKAADHEIVLKDGLYAAAIRPLSSDRRKELLHHLPQSGFGARLTPLLVGASAQLYRCLLDQERLRPYHLAPLAGRPPDAAWAELARLALEAGQEPKSLAEVAFSFEGSYSGFGTEHWGRWETAFRKLSAMASDLQEVARYGLERAQVEVAEAQNRQRQFELTGKF